LEERDGTLIVSYKPFSGFDRAVADAFMKAEEFRITTVTFVMSKCLSLSLFHSYSLSLLLSLSVS
jgi:hypothetical protein